MKQKWLDFCHYYTDQTSKDTCGHGTNSAKKAGYSEKSASDRAYELLKHPEIIAKINDIQQKRLENTEKTIEEKIKIAWQNYEKATAEGDLTEARFWFKAHSELCGHIGKKLTDQDTISREEIQTEIANQIRKVLQEA